MSARGSKADTSISRLIAVLTLQLLTMWRPFGEQVRKFPQVDTVSLFELHLAPLVLLDMVSTAEADRPSIRWLESDTPISVAADVGTLDRALQTAWNAAVMAANPGAVSRALAAVPLAAVVALKPVRKLELGHLRFASVGVMVSVCSIAAPCVWRTLCHLLAPRRPGVLRGAVAVSELSLQRAQHRSHDWRIVRPLLLPRKWRILRHLLVRE